MVEMIAVEVDDVDEWMSGCVDAWMTSPIRTPWIFDATTWFRLGSPRRARAGRIIQHAKVGPVPRLRGTSAQPRCFALPWLVLGPCQPPDPWALVCDAQSHWTQPLRNANQACCWAPLAHVNRGTLAGNWIPLACAVCTFSIFELHTSGDKQPTASFIFVHY
jgi:hypothetical protein